MNWRTMVLVGLVAVLVPAALVVPAQGAGGTEIVTTFKQKDGIEIGDKDSAKPYPATLKVGGFKAGKILDVNVTISFDDQAAEQLVVPKTGAFRPANEEGNFENCPWSVPAGPYGATLPTLNWTNPNGEWHLYLADDFPGGVGDISGGWDLKIKASVKKRVRVK